MSYKKYMTKGQILAKSRLEDDLEIVSVEADEIVCPDGKTFIDAEEAADFLGRHWRSARYVWEWIKGIWNDDPDQFETCDARLWDEGYDYGFVLLPCTGGIIIWSQGRLIATPDKIESLEYEGIRAEIIDEEDMPYFEHDENLLDNLLEEGLLPALEADEDKAWFAKADYVIRGCPIIPGLIAQKCADLIWKEVHGRIPKNYPIYEFQTYSYDEVCIRNEVISQLSKAKLKTWLRYARKLPNDATCHDRMALLNIVARYSINSINQLSKYGDNWNDIWETYWFVPDNRVSLLRKSKEKKFVRALNRIPSNIDISKMSVKEIKMLASQFLYEHVQDNDLAHVASELNLPQYKFEEFQEYWITRKHKESESIPYVSASDDTGKYRMYKLNSDDPRGPLLGLYTNCCQYFGGAGSSCAKHGMEDPQGAFFVIERMGKIIAQSWAWRYNDIIVFDNIEALDKNYLDTIAKLYQEVSNKLLGRLGINKVNVGSGYDDLGVKEYWELTNPAPTPRGTYTDATHQYCISRKED